MQENNNRNVYRPPQGNVKNFTDTLENIYEEISTANGSSEIFILGDFNINYKSTTNACRMSGVPSGQECSGTSRGSSAHAGISQMETSEVLPCRENVNYLKWVAN